MRTIDFILAVEDELSEAVGRALLAQAGERFSVSMVIRRGGAGYLRARIHSFNESARALPFLVLTDLDDPRSCPPELIRSWLGSHRRREKLLFRVAVVEIESWVLAHRSAVAAWLQVPVSRVPRDSDQLPRPKEFLVSLARASRSRQIRDDLVPQTGSTAVVGPMYNSRLVRFVATRWKASEARGHSSSLDRTLRRLESL